MAPSMTTGGLAGGYVLPPHEDGRDGSEPRPSRQGVELRAKSPPDLVNQRPGRSSFTRVTISPGTF